MSGDLYDVADDCAGGREFSGTAAVEHDGSKCIAANHDCIVYVIDCKERMIRSDHHRAYIDAGFIAFHAAGSKQFNRGSQLCRIFEIGIGNLCDALGRHIFVIYFFSRCQ